MIGHLASGWRPWAALTLLCLALYLPGIAALPPLDRDEPRYAQAARQMLETGDFLRIRFQDEARNKKPAGIYWLQAASVALLASPQAKAIWPYRLPSLFGAMASVLLVFAWGSRLVGREAALVGAALLAGSMLLTVEAHVAKTDAVLLAACIAGQGALVELYRRSREGNGGPAALAAVFWMAQGAAMLIKGPVLALMSALTVLALVISDRRVSWLRDLRPLWGVPLAAVIVLPWFIAIQQATGGSFASEAIGHDLLGKVVGAQESHGAPPGAYLLVLPVLFWPGSLLLAGAAALAWRRRRDTAIRALLAWALPFWLVLELMPTKLPNYLLPVLPPLALLAAASLGAEERAWRWPRLVNIALWAVLTIALAGGILSAGLKFGTGLTGAAVAASMVAVLGAATVILFAARHPAHIERSATALPILAALVLAPTFGRVLPSLDGLWLSRQAAALAEREAPRRVLSSVGFAEPSLVFLLGTRTRLVGADQGAVDLAAGGAVLVSSRDESAFRRSVAARHLVARSVGTIEGFNYSNGQRLTLTLYLPG